MMAWSGAFAVAAVVQQRVIDSPWDLISGATLPTKIILTVLAVFSLVIMPVVAFGKLRAAKHIGSAALRAEAKETLACSFLSLALFLGLGLNALFGWWWADPVAALIMVPWLVKEGLEGLRGGCCSETECASSPEEE